MEHRVYEQGFGAAEQKFIHDVIDKAMETKDRSVTLYFGNYGCSVSIYPISEDEESEE